MNAPALLESEFRMTIDELITPELRDAWVALRKECCVCLYGECHTIGCMKRGEDGNFVRPFEFIGCKELRAANAIRDLLAALLESEFRLEHVVKEHDSPITGKYSMCGICPMELDPRHNYQWPDWQAAATKILEAK